MHRTALRNLAINGDNLIRRSAGVGVARLANGSYLYASKRGGSNSLFDFYYSTNIEGMRNFQPASVGVPGVAGAENVSLITECGTGKLFMIATIADGKLIQTSGRNYWRLYELQRRGDEIELEHLATAKKDRTRECNARASATATASKDGKLNLYCHQRAEASASGGQTLRYRRYLNQ